MEYGDNLRGRMTEEIKEVCDINVNTFFMVQSYPPI